MVCDARKVILKSNLMFFAIILKSTLGGVKCSLVTFQRIPGSRYTSELGSQHALFEEQCMFACKNISTCSTVSYSMKSKTCYIGTSWINTDHKIEDPDFDILYRKDKPYCRSTICYELISEKLNWNDAKTFCEIQHQEGHLAHIHTENNMDLFMSLNIQDNVWIGATDASSEGDFYWTDNSLVSKGYTFWDEGQPDDGGTEDCLIVRADWDYHWNDSECYKKRRFVCQYSFRI